MYKGIYIALSGAITKQKHMDILAQNIANVNTPGYKKERVAFRDYLIPLTNGSALLPDGRIMSGPPLVMTDFSSGELRKTGNPLDVAIDGSGFFALEGNRYTRAGNFKVSSDGYLVTQSGIKVLGNGGPISLQGSRIEISPSGDVSVDGIVVDTLTIVDFPDKGVLKGAGEGTFVTEEQGQEIRPLIRQGYLEDSNTEIIKEMVQMITTYREFESYQRIIRALDEATAKTINEMGKK